jgi:hypothetical protein
MELFQMNEITAEEVKCSCINASERESAIHFYWFRNKADSFSSMLQLTKNMFTPIKNSH